MAETGLEVHHVTLTPEQLSTAKQRGDVASVTEIPGAQGSLIKFAEAIQEERIRRNRDNPHSPEPVLSIAAQVQQIESEMAGGKIPAEVSCDPQVLEVITGSR